MELAKQFLDTERGMTTHFDKACRKGPEENIQMKLWFRSICSTLAIAVCILGAAPAGAYSVMAIGDSITAGYVPPASPNGSPTYNGGYIPILSNWLGGGYNFIGSQQTGGYHHEGYPGATWQDFSNPNSGFPWIGNLPSQAPDIMLIHIGTNNINRGDDPNQVAARVVDSILDTIDNQYQNKTPIDVYLAQIIPIDTVAGRTAVKAFDDALASYLDAWPWNYSNLNLHRVNMYGLFPDSTGYYPGDSLHPDAEGYQRMASAWYTAITGQAAPVPLPTPVFLLAGGLAGLACIRRRMGK
jgi:lysophospholipase L1-like esterase